MFFEKLFLISINIKSAPPIELGDNTSTEQELPSDTLLTLEISNQDIPILFSHLVVNGRVLQHPAVKQHQEVPFIEHDARLDLLTSTSNDPSNDPNEEMTHDHVLSPSMIRAAHTEQSMIDGPSEVR